MGYPSTITQLDSLIHRLSPHTSLAKQFVSIFTIGLTRHSTYIMHNFCLTLSPLDGGQGKWLHTNGRFGTRVGKIAKYGPLIAF
jgi:hypothetical protein